MKMGIKNYGCDRRHDSQTLEDCVCILRHIRMLDFLHRFLSPEQGAMFAQCSYSVIKYYRRFSHDQGQSYEFIQFNF